MYLTAVIDLYSRYVLNWSISNTMEASWCKEMIGDAIQMPGKPSMINTDQGSQYASTVFSEFVLDQSIRLSMDGKGRAIDNALIERLWRTVKYENIRFKEYRNGLDLYTELKEYFIEYNETRRHTSIADQRQKEVFENGLRPVNESLKYKDNAAKEPVKGI